MRPFAVLVADHHRETRRGLVHVVQGLDDFQVAAEVEDGYAAVQKARELQPDIVLLDVALPGLDGFRAFAAMDPAPLCIFVASEAKTALKAFDAGARDFVLKPITPGRLHMALRRAADSVAEIEASRLAALVPD